MKIWIGESKNLIKDCIDHLIKNYGASDYYNIKSKINNSTYLEQVNYLYLLNNNTIGSGRDRYKFEAIKAKELHLHDILHISKQSLMTIENTKIWIGGDVEKSKKVQEILFKLGCEWSNGHIEIIGLRAKYIRVSSDKEIYFSSSCEKEFFLKLDGIEISYEDLCQMYPTNTEPELTYSGLFPPRSKAEEEATTTMGAYERGLMPKHLMYSCDVGEGKDSSINIFFDKLKGTKWEDCKNEDNFIQPSHLKRIEHSTKQIPSWGGKLYVIPKIVKKHKQIKAKRAWEIL